MNERIRELRVQATEWMKTQGHPHQYRSVWEKQCDEKFVELIVRECAHVAFNAAYPNNGVEVLKAIKEHFGVE